MGLTKWKYVAYLTKTNLPQVYVILATFINFRTIGFLAPKDFFWLTNRLTMSVQN